MSLGRIVYRNPRELTEAADNPRSIDPEAFERLKANIEAAPDMLEARPLIFDLDAEEVIAGNMRLRAILELGWEEVPTYEKHFEDAAERREWQMRDNVGFGEWVPDEVARLIALHRDEGGDLELLGFSQFEAEGYLAVLEQGAEPGGGEPSEPDAAPSLPADPVTNVGDLIELGDHVLICGDAGDVRELDRLIETAYGTGIEFVECLLTDPPYGIDHDTDYSSMKGIGQGKNYRRVAGDSPAELADCLPRVFDYFSDVPEWFLFGADYYLDLWPGFKTGARPGSWVVWDKRSESSDEGFGSAFELIASRSRHQRMILRHLWFGMFGGEGDEARNRLHPTQKPVGLLRDIIERWGGGLGAVVDPFAGSGSTLIACEQLRRPCYALELDPAYCDVIVERWENYTGREAARP